MKKVIATYDQDSKRYHRFVIDGGQGIVGNIYVPRNDNIPNEVVIVLKTKGEKTGD